MTGKCCAPVLMDRRRSIHAPSHQHIEAVDFRALDVGGCIGRQGASRDIGEACVRGIMVKASEI